jgi:GNAT superfamily N-acetyltransferase
MSIKIVPFQASLATAFRDLNLEWLTVYFFVEPKDSELLDRCEEVIIKKGGAIFFALKEDIVAGCFSLLPVDDKSYELGKMAVKKEFQGHKVGQELLKFALSYAKEQHREEIILYSNTLLEPAIYLYRKFGFTEIEMEKPPPYQRSNIKMSLKL